MHNLSNKGIRFLVIISSTINLQRSGSLKPGNIFASVGQPESEGESRSVSFDVSKTGWRKI